MPALPESSFTLFTQLSAFVREPWRKPQSRISGTVEEVVEYVLENPGSTTSDIADYFKISGYSAYTHLHVAINDGRIKKVGTKPLKYYAPDVAVDGVHSKY